MKKILGIGLVATAIMMGCSNDETVEMVGKAAIKFDNAFVDKHTRATDITKDNIENFAVYGFVVDPTGVIFADEKVEKDGTNWKYTNTQYWAAGKSHWFTAIAPAVGGWEFVSVSNDTPPYLGGGKITFTNNAETDLLYAWSGEVTCADPLPLTIDPVAFIFKHLLSRVKFTFENALENSNTTLKISGIKITDAYKEGSINMNAVAPVWEDWSTDLEVTFDGITNAIPGKGGTKSSDHKYLIPATKAYKLNFSVDMYQGEVNVGTYPFSNVDLPMVDMKPGFSYNFKATLNAESFGLKPIVFTVDKVEDWGDWSEKDRGNVPPASVVP